MEQKYLPIGSVCTLKGKNKKMMITGYYAVEFNGNIKISDYCGCVYPEGELLSEQRCNFNHDDIEKIDFVGYKNEELYKFQRIFNSCVGNEQSDEEEAKEFHLKNDMHLTSSKTYSKLLFDENGVVMIAEPVVESKDSKKPKIEFDENGYVVSVIEDDEVSNPFKKNYEYKDSENDEPSDWKIFDKSEVESNEDDKKLDSSSLSQIEFDENGIVVSVTGENLNSKYTFDEDGTLIAIDESLEDSKESASTDENE